MSEIFEKLGLCDCCKRDCKDKSMMDCKRFKKKSKRVIRKMVQDRIMRINLSGSFIHPL